jgi:hypothetical protein
MALPLGVKIHKGWVPCVSNWVLNDVLKVVDFKKQQNFSRS